ncbi:DUF2510 domain-containing protein [Mycolicibacterium fortuitum]|uniref:DUF2510 domain-containing protein n=2 Tax=Mycolicibacterium fortuitum TaxID=1766 RepID=UPI0026242694|nr:DUF2510 domain-containing protein [Mycolicibacterium fortuitum]
MTEPKSPGWYPDPLDSSSQRYWDGTVWGDRRAPQSPAADDRPSGRQNTVAVGVCALSIIGFVISMQSVSLMTGTGQIWLGVGLTAVGVACAFFLGADTLVRVLSVVVLIVAAANALYVENQLSNKRTEISRMFNP